MKGTFFRFLSGLTCAFILMTLSFPSFALESKFSSETENNISKIHEKNQQSYYYATRFKEKYTTIVITKTTQDASIEYPSNYGGIYIDSNNDLHISYVDNLEGFTSDMNDYE